MPATRRSIHAHPMLVAMLVATGTWLSNCAADTDTEPLEDGLVQGIEQSVTDPNAPLPGAETANEDTVSDENELVDSVDDPNPNAENEATASAPASSIATSIDGISAGAVYQNAVFPNCADPGVIRVEEGGAPAYYLVCTGGRFAIRRSTDLVHWTDTGSFLLPAHHPWATTNFWAPEIHRVGDHFVAYYAAAPADGRSCIGATSATNILGPWTDLGHPLVCNRHMGIIDPNEVTDARGRHYLYYKSEGNAQHPHVPTVIYVQRLSDDGLHLTTFPRALLHNRLPWEGWVIEAPWVMKHGRFYYMFYSANCFCNATYAVGVARSTSPTGPFLRHSTPILHSNSAWVGPGHNSVVRAENGHEYIVYHAYNADEVGVTRRLMLDRIEWVHGWPRINNGTPSRGAQPVP